MSKKTRELEDANAALGRQVAQMETLYAQVPAGLCFLDSDLRFVRINEELAAVHGAPVSAHIGRSLREIAATPLADAVEPLYRSVLETGKPLIGYEVRGPAQRHWIVSCSRVTAEGGAPIGLQVVVQDISGRKESEDALARANADLRRGEEQFRTLANAIPQLCWMANGEGWIFWYNDRWYQYTGCTPDQMQGWGWQSVHDPKVLPDVIERWRLSIDTGEPFEMVFPLRGADGVFRPFLTRVHPLKDPHGQVWRWFGTNTDITGSKAIEDALKQTNEALRRANEDLGQFAYIAAHDLQEPLRAIVSFSQLVERRCGGNLDQDSAQYLKQVVDAGKRMSHLISDVLAYSCAAIESEQQADRVNLDDVLDSVLERLEPQMVEAQASIARDRLPVVEGDAVRLGQVFQNLISNALKYRKPGIAPRIRLSADRQDSHWRFALSDNGEGFNQEYAKRIFGIFKRLHGSEIPGSGIGLAICKTIVERHGGTIWAEARKGSGATFLFTLPVARNDYSRSDAFSDQPSAAPVKAER